MTIRLPLIGIVPLYEPSDEVLQALAPLAEQLDGLVAVDDSPTPASCNDDFEQSAAMLFLSSVGNRGIAAASNAGVGRAESHWGAKIALLFLDQDSVVGCSDYINYLRALDIEENAPKILVPAKLGNRSQALRWKSGEPLDPMASGWCMTADTFKLVGGFREDLWIDMVDSEFLLRARKNHVRPQVVPGTSINHRLGRSAPRSIYGQQIMVTNHPPARRYYMSRNRLLVYKWHWSVDWEWSIRRAHHYCRDTIKIVFEAELRRKLLALWVGVFHAAIGKTGQAPGYLLPPVVVVEDRDCG